MWFLGMVVVVAGLMLLVVAGGPVWMPEGASYTTVAEGFVVATRGNSPCLTADGTFGGKSTTAFEGDSDPFETCFQLGKYDTYCWSKSFHHDGTFFTSSKYYQCSPLPPATGGTWYPVDPQYVNPITHPYSCGSPCQDMYHDGDY